MIIICRGQVTGKVFFSHCDQRAWGQVHLCHPHRPVAFQEPDHEEKAQETLLCQWHTGEEDAGVEGDYPVRVHPLILLDSKLENMPLGAERQQVRGQIRKKYV